MLLREPLLGRDSLSWYTSSLEDDREIVVEVLEVERAHVSHLVQRNLVPAQEGEKILGVLEELAKDPEQLFREKDAEDVFEALELVLERRLGSSAGWLSLGRSRNDHIAAVLRLKIKRMVLKTMSQILGLRRTLLDKALEKASTIFPSYTHAREAQPITFGHYLISIEEELDDHYHMLEASLGVVDTCPLGAGAVGGTTVEIDRELLAKSLGFSGHSRNTLYLVSSRSFLTIPLSVVVSLATSLSRVASDLMAWSSKTYGMISLPPRHTATSSIMPHKINPVTLEILRARSGEAVGLLAAVMSMYRALHAGYNLDFQEINRIAWKIFRIASESLEILKDLIGDLVVNADRARELAEDLELVAADVVERISIEKRMPHREAHRIVAKAIKEGRLEELLTEFNMPRRPEHYLEMKRFRGSPRPDDVISYARERISEAEKDLRDLKMLEEKSRSRASISGAGNTSKV